MEIITMTQQMQRPRVGFTCPQSAGHLLVAPSCGFGTGSVSSASGIGGVAHAATSIVDAIKPIYGATTSTTQHDVAYVRSGRPPV